MISMLITVLILGALVTVVLVRPHGSTPSGATTGGAATTTTTPQSLASVVPPARVAACEADFNVLEAAVSQYETLNGGPPAPGTAWATSTSNSGPFLQSWPSGAPNFSLSWNGSRISVIPRKGTPSRASYGTNSPPTGCFAP
jgi:hypothetical protein